jgi:hypothetical protein
MGGGEKYYKFTDMTSFTHFTAELRLFLSPEYGEKHE